MLSEFGRTPKINDDAGRDHHAAVFSCLIAGGGIKGGQVIGSSDEDGVRPKDRPVEVPDIHATVCHALGIDPTKEVMTPLQRPMKLVDGGEAGQGVVCLTVCSLIHRSPVDRRSRAAFCVSPPALVRTFDQPLCNYSR